MSVNKNVLVVDDEVNICTLFEDCLSSSGFTVKSLHSYHEVEEEIEETSYLLVFLDIYLEGKNSIPLIEKIKEISPDTKIIVMTGHGRMRLSIDAIKAGAYDYLTKPVDLSKIKEIANKTLEASKSSSKDNQDEFFHEYEAEEIIGKSAAVEAIFKKIAHISNSDISVLIRGESGTGKELAARAIHNNSSRGESPFIAVNCAAIPKDLLGSELFGHERGSFTSAVNSKKGTFELANNGTIFLDEIGDMPLEMQAAILRVLQEKEFYKVGGEKSVKVDVRIIAATHRPLEELMEEGNFREDLFYRLNEVTLELPPLRERKEDIEILVFHFLNKYSEGLNVPRKNISWEALDIIKEGQWPGNIRELENTIKYAFSIAQGDEITKEDLPEKLFREKVNKNHFTDYIIETIDDFITDDGNSVHKGTLYKDIIRTVEHALFQTVYKKTNYNQVVSSKILGINRNTFRTKIKEMKIDQKPSQSE